MFSTEVQMRDPEFPSLDRWIVRTVSRIGAAR